MSNKSNIKKGDSFPHKLMQILSTASYDDIITWLPDGKAFKILKPKDFTNRILPLYFKEAKYSSFKRKLHRWGFDRRRTPEDNSVPKSDWYGSEETFFHQKFQKNNIDLLDDMECLKNGKATTTSKPQPNPAVKITTLSKPPTTTVGASPFKPINASVTKTTKQVFMKPSSSSIRRSATEAFRTVSSGPPRKRIRSVEVTNTYPEARNMDAIIEAEVARRVKEQMAAARLSEQRAFFMIEQQRRQRYQRQQAEAAMYHREIMLKRAIANYSGVAAQPGKYHNQKTGVAALGSSSGSPLASLPSEVNVMPRTA